MNATRLAALKSWLATNRWRVDVERGLVLSQDGTRAIGRGISKGYPATTIAGTTYGIHEIIAVAGGLDIVGREVNHIDGNKRNSAIANLEPVSPAENARHAARMGLVTHAAGETHGRAKLTWGAVRAIRAEYQAAGVSQAALAAKYGVSEACIRKIVCWQTWVGQPDESQAA